MTGVDPRRSPSRGWPAIRSCTRPRRVDRVAGSSTLLALALVLATLVLPTAVAEAARAKVVTALSLQVPAALDLGVHPQVRVRLTANGAPVAGQLVSIRLDAKTSQQVTSGADGTAAATITRDLSAGTYQVIATFAGTTVYRSASSPTRALVVRPAQLTIATVPSTPNIPLIKVGRGAALKTGADGTVKVSMTDVGQVALTLALPADGPDVRFRLDRWDDGSTDPVRTIRIPDTLQVTIGLQILHPVRFAFSAPDGTPVDAAYIPFVGISDGAGAEQALAGPAPYWLDANAITRLTNGLTSAPVDYRIVTVQIDGADVVNRGQQRFVVDAPETIDVELLVFNLAVHGRDALIKTPAGSKATITSTTGVTHVVDLDSHGDATIRLPRGEYRLVLRSGLGVPLSTPVALSRDQGVDVLFVSFLDIAMAFGLALLAAVGLIVIGRPHVLRWRLVRPKLPDGPVATEEPEPPVVAWPDPSTRPEAPRREQRPRTGP